MGQGIFPRNRRILEGRRATDRGLFRSLKLIVCGKGEWGQGLERSGLGGRVSSEARTRPDSELEIALVFVCLIRLTDLPALRHRGLWQLPS